MIGVVFMFLLVISLFVCGFVVTCRLDCNNCGADFQRIKNTKSSRKRTLMLYLILLALYGCACIEIGIFNGLAFNGVYKTDKIIEEEIHYLSNSYNIIIDNVKDLENALPIKIESGLYLTENFEDIKNEINVIYDHTLSFERSAYAYEVILYSWVWLQSFFTLLFSILIIVGFKSKDPKMLLIRIPTILLFVFLVFHLAYLACFCSQIFMVADICEQMYTISTFNIVPTTELGLAYFIKPFTHESIGKILAQTYIIATTYDEIFIHAKTRESTGLDNKQWNIILKDVYTYEEFIAEGINLGGNFSTYREMLTPMKDTLERLYDMRYQRTLRKMSKDSIQPLCAVSLHYSAFIFYGMVIATFILMCIIIIAIRIGQIRSKIQYDTESLKQMEEEQQRKRNDDDEL